MPSDSPAGPPGADGSPEAARLDGYRRAAAMCRAAAEHMEAGRTPPMPAPAALRLMAITLDRACEDNPPD